MNIATMAHKYQSIWIVCQSFLLVLAVEMSRELWGKNQFEVEKNDSRLHDTWLSSVRPLKIADNVYRYQINPCLSLAHTLTHTCIVCRFADMRFETPVSNDAIKWIYRAYNISRCTLQLLPFHVYRPKFYDYTVQLARFNFFCISFNVNIE